MLDDPLFWVLVLPGLLLGAYAQWRIKANVTEYSQIPTENGITGAEVARRLLNSQGLQAVKIEATPGMLTDHYDPRSKILRLSQDVYFTPSVAAAGLLLMKRDTQFKMQTTIFFWKPEPISCRSYNSRQKLRQAVRGRADVATSIVDVGGSGSVRFLLPLCVPHPAS